MFVSENVVKGKNYSCLTTLRTEGVHGKTWQRSVVYNTFPDSTAVLTFQSLLTTKKTEDCYVYDDAFTVTDTEGEKETSWRCKVIYTDLENCILLKSRYLGYQVWASKSYVEMHNEIPYICVLQYEIYAGLTKYWVYDWETCPSRVPV
ncbi:hypothetical protein V5799_032229 [Amblyomma americanum]|uniref:Uncharacterized protein n=1 Tax=Amblyomma americanum TaxID=6943 RepID=A0AAQ4DRS4_AMBAM